MQNRMIYANMIFSYFKNIRLNFYSHNKTNYSSHSCPSTNHYNSLPDSTISLYFDPEGTSLHWLHWLQLIKKNEDHPAPEPVKQNKNRN